MLLFISNETIDFAEHFGVEEFSCTCVTHVALPELQANDGTFIGDFDIAIVRGVASTTDPMSTLRSIRDASDVPILCISESSFDDGPTQCVVAFEFGADDFLHEPIAPEELAARIRARMRRPSLASSNPRLEQSVEAGDLELHLGERKASCSGQKLNLTPVEFDLLHLLVKSAGTVVTRDAISKTIFGSQTKLQNRAIDVHMSRLRKKIGDELNGEERIRTIHGAGYFISSGTNGSN